MKTLSMKRNFPRFPWLAPPMIALCVSSGSGLAQTSLYEETLDVVPDEEASAIGFRSGEFIAAPIPFSNPTIGDGLAAGGAWLFYSDPESSTSSIGLGGFRTDNGSQGLAFAADLKFSRNRYLVSLLAGEVDLEYDFQAGSLDIPLKQTGELYKAQFAYGFSQQFSLGFGLQYAQTSISTGFGGALPPELSASLDLDVFKYGLSAMWDDRDSDLYPTSGSRITFDAFQGEVTGRIGRDYQKAVLKASHFQPVSAGQGVLALSGTLCRASGSAPFFDSCSIGLTDDLRGFSVTEYIGETLVSAQAEYRGRMKTGRFGYAAFLGAGSVSGTRTSDAGVHAAAGLGIRYRLSKTLPVDFSVDATINSDNETLYYIYVGQAF